MAVTVTGSVLSSLCYDHGNSKSDQEGLLLGQVVNHITDTISDSQLNNVKEETITYIYSYVPCRGLFSWYDNRGQILIEKLRGLLPNDKHKEVVGWYKFRRASLLTVSLRERAIHYHLKEAFPGIAPQNFIFCLFTTSATSNLATHSFDHVFQFCDGRAFHKVPLNIVNLKDTSHVEYKLHSSNTVNPAAGLFSETVSRFQPEFARSSGKLHQVASVQGLNTHIHNKLSDLCEEVTQTETQLGMLSLEVDALRERVRLKQQNRTSPVKENKQPVEPWEPLRNTPAGVVPMDTDLVTQTGDTAKKNFHLDIQVVTTESSSTDSPERKKPEIHEDLLELIDAPCLSPSNEAIQTQNTSEANQTADNESPQEDMSEMIIELTEEPHGGKHIELQKEPPSDKKKKQQIEQKVKNTDKRSASPKPKSKVDNEARKDSGIAKKGKGDAFSFVSDLLMEARSPTGNGQKFQYSTLPRTSSTLPRTSSRERSTAAQDSGKRITKSSRSRSNEDIDAKQQPERQKASEKLNGKAQSATKETRSKAKSSSGDEMKVVGQRVKSAGAKKDSARTTRSAQSSKAKQTKSLKAEEKSEPELSSSPTF